MVSCLPFTVAAAPSEAQAEETEVIAMDPVPEVEARNIVLYSMDTGAIVYEKGGADKVYPASITKIMTMIVILENCPDLSVMVTVKDTYDDDLVYGSSTLPLSVGEQMSMQDLLYAIALKSANDAANVAAEHVGGDLAGFIEMMNQKAAEIGAKDTHFVNAHGLHDEDHYTSARDVAKIMEYGLKNNWFQTLLGTYSRTLDATNKSGKRLISTTNQLIAKNGANARTNYYKFSCGGKTGTTTPAGYNLVSWASKDDKEFICVAMNAEKTNYNQNPIFKNSKALYEWAFDNYLLQPVINVNDPQSDVPVLLSAETEHTVLTASSSMDAILAKDALVKPLICKVELKNKLVSKIKKGESIGQISVEYDGKVLGACNILALKDIKRETLFADNKAMLSWANDACQNQIFSTTPNTSSNTAEWMVESNLSSVLPTDKPKNTLIYIIELPSEVLAPLKKGDLVGKMTVSHNGVDLGSTDLVAGEDISRSPLLYYLYKIEKLIQNIWVQIIALVIVAFVIIYIILMIRRNRARRRRRVRLKPRIRY